MNECILDRLHGNCTITGRITRGNLLLALSSLTLTGKEEDEDDDEEEEEADLPGGSATRVVEKRRAGGQARRGAARGKRERDEVGQKGETLKAAGRVPRSSADPL